MLNAADDPRHFPIGIYDEIEILKSKNKELKRLLNSIPSSLRNNDNL